MPTKPKPVSQELTDAIQQAAVQVSIHAPSFSSGNGKAFETWIFLEAAAVLQTNNAVLARDSHGKPTSEFRVCGAPSNLPTMSTSAASEPCHFLVGDHRELHAGLLHRGASGDSHELDVSVVSTHDAAVLRHGRNREPYQGTRYAGIELKEYDAAGSLPKTYARALLGVALDLDPLRFIYPVELRLGGQAVFHWHDGFFNSPNYMLLTTAALTGPTRSLLNHYRMTWVDCVAAGHLPSEFEAFVSA
ncbi:hypothetical protein [Aureimonas sp. ME7]|uniref:hypothetical protein n=1 Tax=Aureimonas sp. ME7 TaxID=2744252 RepID=UPI0015F3C9E4|nr:hypothetical protein [Aureimonas sp. ME7]